MLHFLNIEFQHFRRQFAGLSAKLYNSAYRFYQAVVAQLVEQLIRNQ